MQNKKIFWIFVISFFFLLFPGGYQASAQVSTNCRKLPELTWLEFRSNYFTFIYPEIYSEYVLPYFESSQMILDQKYELLSRIFEEDLELPIIIRIYPEMDYYTCLNLYESEIIHRNGFTRIGRREIAIVLNNNFQEDMMTEEVFINGVIGQLAQLFAAKITDDKAPVGLIFGISNYFENKKIDETSVADKPINSWRKIWDGKPIPRIEKYAIETKSIVAYLIDRYEWPTFVIFLRNLSTSENYNEALSLTYHKDFTVLQDEWNQYFQIYIQGRWRINPIFNYDLNVIEESIKIGAYTEVKQKINEIKPFLEDTGQSDILVKIKPILETATKGETAGLLVINARQALQSGDYELSKDLSTQALTIYEEINDERRLEEIKEYQRISEEVLLLRSDFDKDVEKIDQIAYVEAHRQLVSYSNKFTFYGDSETLAEIETISDRLTMKQISENREPLMSFGVFVLIILLIRLVMIFHKRPVEVL